MRNLDRSDYELGPAFTKEFSLVGKDKKKEKLRVMEKSSLFNKNFKVVVVEISLGLLKYLNTGVKVWQVWMQG